MKQSEFLDKLASLAYTARAGELDDPAREHWFISEIEDGDHARYELEKNDENPGPFKSDGDVIESARYRTLSLLNECTNRGCRLFLDARAISLFVHYVARCEFLEEQLQRAKSEKAVAVAQSKTREVDREVTVRGVTALEELKHHLDKMSTWNEGNITILQREEDGPLSLLFVANEIEVEQDG